jgi:hypothetical protein
MRLNAELFRSIAETKISVSKRPRIYMSTTNGVDGISFESSDVVENVDNRDEKALDNLTVSELRERLRVRGLKVRQLLCYLLTFVFRTTNVQHCYCIDFV